MSQRGKGSVNARKIDADDAYNQTVTRADQKTKARVHPQPAAVHKEGDRFTSGK
jgi:hypothetical protein